MFRSFFLSFFLSVCSRSSCCFSFLLFFLPVFICFVRSFFLAFVLSFFLLFCLSFFLSFCLSFSDSFFVSFFRSSCIYFSRPLLLSFVAAFFRSWFSCLSCSSFLVFRSFLSLWISFALSLFLSLFPLMHMIRLLLMISSYSFDASSSSSLLWFFFFVVFFSSSPSYMFCFRGCLCSVVCLHLSCVSNTYLCSCASLNLYFVCTWCWFPLPLGFDLCGVRVWWPGL